MYKGYFNSGTVPFSLISRYRFLKITKRSEKEIVMSYKLEVYQFKNKRNTFDSESVNSNFMRSGELYLY